MTSTAAGPNQGTPADPSAPPDCAELKRRNEQNREDMERQLTQKKQTEGLTKDEKDTLRKASKGGMTFSSATVVGPPGSSFGRVMSGCSSGKCNALLPSTVVDGGSSEVKGGLKADERRRTPRSQAAAQRKKDAGTMCDGNYVHAGGGAGAHAEAKIFNQLAENGSMAQLRGGTITLSIDWRYQLRKGGKVYRSGMACRHCYKMLCYALTQCGININVCGKDGKPQSLSQDDCTRKKGKLKDDPYRRFDQRVDQYQRQADFSKGQT